MFTNLTADQLKPKAKAYKKADKLGLYLFVTPSGYKSWRYKYSFGGKERVLVIGSYPEIGLTAARIRRNDAFKAIQEGRDPGAEKKLAVEALGDRVFETVARQWLDRKVEAKRRAGKPLAPEYALDLLRCLELYVFPEIGRLNVDAITSRHVIEMLDKIVPARAEIIRRRLVLIFKYAAAMQLRSDSNPAEIASETMNERPEPAKMPALVKLPAVVELLQKVDAADAYVVLKLAARFIALTAARPGMVMGARWDELGTDDETGRLVWTIPAARMKMREDFTCPLSTAAVAITDALRPVSGHFEYIFPSGRDGRLPMARTAVVRLLAEIGYRDIHVAHGFRSSFSTIMHQHHKGAADLVAIEFQLAHTIKGVAGRYNRSAYIARRTELVDEWASWLTPTLAAPAEIVGERVARSATADPVSLVPEK